MVPGTVNPCPGASHPGPVECTGRSSHHHTPLTPVSLRLFRIVPVVLPLRELTRGRPRPTVGDDITWFLREHRDDRVPWPSGFDRLRASCEPHGATPPTTGFPTRVQIVSWAVRGPADDRRPVGGTAELRDVHRPPGTPLSGGDRRDVHVLVDLAVRRSAAAPRAGGGSSAGAAASSAPDAVADVRRER